MENNGWMPTLEEIQKFLKTERKIDIKDDVVVQLLNLIDLNSTSELSFTTDNFDSIPHEEKQENLLLLQVVQEQFQEKLKEQLLMVVQ